METADRRENRGGLHDRSRVLHGVDDAGVAATADKHEALGGLDDDGRVFGHGVFDEPVGVWSRPLTLQFRSGLTRGTGPDRHARRQRVGAACSTKTPPSALYSAFRGSRPFPSRPAGSGRLVRLPWPHAQDRAFGFFFASSRRSTSRPPVWLAWLWVMTRSVISTGPPSVRRRCAARFRRARRCRRAGDGRRPRGGRQTPTPDTLARAADQHGREHGDLHVVTGASPDWAFARAGAIASIATHKDADSGLVTEFYLPTTFTMRRSSPIAVRSATLFPGQGDADAPSRIVPDVEAVGDCADRLCGHWSA